MNRLQPGLPLFSIILILAVAQGGCVLLGGGTKTPPVFGTWDFTMDNVSSGTITGTITLQEDADESYSGTVTAPDAGLQNTALDIESLEIAEPAFTLKASAAGTPFTIVATVEGDTMSGTNDVVGVGLFQFSATRVQE